MMRDATEFRQRFADWKAGEKVYDAGRSIPKYDGGTDDKTYLPQYEYEAAVTPQGTSLEKHKRITNEEDWLKYWGDVGAEYVNRALESVAEPVLEGLKNATYFTPFAPLTSAVETVVNLHNQDYLGAALSAAAGIPGLHSGYKQALPLLGKITKPYTNYFASKALSNAIEETANLGLLRSNTGKFVKIHPAIRTKIGDVEIDNPNLFYRQGGGTMGSEFLKKGVVDADGEYVNPMFKRGGLWYGLEDAKEAYTVTEAPKKGKFGLLFKPRVSNGKPDLIVSTAEMVPANNKSRPLREILTTRKNGIYTNVDFSRADPWMHDFMKLWNDAYYLGVLNESPVTHVTKELARSVPKTKDGATAANSTLFRYEPGYGFRKYPKDDFSKTSLDFLRAAIRADESKLLGEELPASFRTSVLSKKFSGGGEHFVSVDPNDANYVIKYSRLGLPKESLLKEIADTEIMNKYSDIVEPQEYLGYTNEGDGFVRGYYRQRHIIPLDEARAIKYSNRPEEYDRIQEIAENAYDRIRANVPLRSSMFVHEPGTNIIIPEGEIGDYGKMHNIGFGSKGKPVIFDPMFHGNSLEATLYYRMRQLLRLTPLDKGKSIHINPANKGKFNATKKRTGKTTEQLAHSKNPLTRKRAIFALNARKWKH